jgi:rhamnosyltransferase
VNVAGSNSAAYSIGIVIRTWNEVGFLEKCIRSLKSQRMDLVSSMEIQVIDSYSPDGTAELSRREGCSLIEIPREEFNYGDSLNTGISALGQELVISLSAHAIPQGDDFLNTLVESFADPKVAGTYVKQIPWPDAPFREKVRIRHVFDDRPRSFSKPGDPEMHFSNVASCFRRSLWEGQPFHSLPSSEDFYWAEDMLAKGYSIVYRPSSAVYHSHNDSCAAYARRFYTILRNELETNKRSPALELARVARASLSHIRGSLKMCLTEPGSFGERLSTAGNSFVEAFLILKQHLKKN